MSFTDGEIYQSNFDPAAYLASFCSFGTGRDSILKFRLQKCFETFGPGGIGGDVLIDIGTGPSIYQLLSACEAFRSIIATDFTDKNRQELEKWLRKDPGAYDWSEFSKAVCELEGDKKAWNEKEEKLRAAIKKVLKCDVTKSNPLDPASIPPADGVISALCLETACQDLSSYQTALRNIGSLLRPGGHLVLIGVLGDSFYKVGQQRFSCLPLDEQKVQNAVVDAGFTVKKMEVFIIPDAASHADITDSYGNFFLVAKKEADK
ncbi:indolethylamine N-methyltransferase-like [Spea bombifrons]|uniref:indolethylamine N-methyltransferase-like n=1 Tax=Spea bombifrons TaxID=233779 RepID=UPI00234A9AE0|nr:indolethylamine N-methyltransferase-like [Spea bombifrons]